MEIDLENIFAFLFVLKSWPFQNNYFSVLVPSQHCWNPPPLEHPGPFRWGDRQIVPATAKVRITTKQKFAQIFCLIAHFLFSTFILWTFEPHLNIQNDQPEPLPLHLQYQKISPKCFSTSQSSTSVHVRPSSPSASQSINANRSSWTKLMPGQEYLFEMLTYLEGGHHETIFLPLPREKLNRRIGRASSILNPALSLETTDKRQLKKEKGKTFFFSSKGGSLLDRVPGTTRLGPVCESALFVTRSILSHSSFSYILNWVTFILCINCGLDYLL